MAFRISLTPLRERTKFNSHIGELITDNIYGDISLKTTEDDVESPTKQIKSDIISTKIRSDIINKKLSKEIENLGTYNIDDEIFNIQSEINNNILGSLKYMNDKYAKILNENVYIEDNRLNNYISKIYGSDENSYSYKLRNLLYKMLKNNETDEIKEFDNNDLYNLLVVDYLPKIIEFERKISEFEYKINELNELMDLDDGPIPEMIKKVYLKYLDSKELLKGKKFTYYNKENMFDEKIPIYENHEYLQTENELKEENKNYPNYLLSINNNSKDVISSYYKDAFANHFIENPLSFNFDGNQNLVMLNSHIYDFSIQKNSNSGGMEFYNDEDSYYWNYRINCKTNATEYINGNNIIPAIKKINNNNGIYSIDPYYSTLKSSYDVNATESFIFDRRFRKRVFLNNDSNLNLFYDDDINSFNFLMNYSTDTGVNSNKIFLNNIDININKTFKSNTLLKFSTKNCVLLQQVLSDIEGTDMAFNILPMINFDYSSYNSVFSNFSPNSFKDKNVKKALDDFFKIYDRNEILNQYGKYISDSSMENFVIIQRDSDNRYNYNFYNSSYYIPFLKYTIPILTKNDYTFEMLINDSLKENIDDNIIFTNFKGTQYSNKNDNGLFSNKESGPFARSVWYYNETYLTQKNGLSFNYYNGRNIENYIINDNMTIINNDLNIFINNQTFISHISSIIKSFEDILNKKLSIKIKDINNIKFDNKSGDYFTIFIDTNYNDNNDTKTKIFVTTNKLNNEEEALFVKKEFINRTFNIDGKIDIEAEFALDETNDGYRFLDDNSDDSKIYSLKIKKNDIYWRDLILKYISPKDDMSNFTNFDIKINIDAENHFMNILSPDEMYKGE